MATTASFRRVAQYIGLVTCGLMMHVAFGVLDILWDVVREIINGMFQVAIGVIVTVFSTIAYFGLILWLSTL